MAAAAAAAAAELVAVRERAVATTLTNLSTDVPQPPSRRRRV